MWLNAIFLFFSTHLPPGVVFCTYDTEKLWFSPHCFSYCLPSILETIPPFDCIPHLFFILFIISPVSCDTNQFHHSCFPPKAKADLLYKQPHPLFFFPLHNNTKSWDCDPRSFELNEICRPITSNNYILHPSPCSKTFLYTPTVLRRQASALQHPLFQAGVYNVLAGGLKRLRIISKIQSERPISWNLKPMFGEPLPNPQLSGPFYMQPM